MSCSPSGCPSTGRSQERTIAEELAAHGGELLAIPGVVGVAEGESGGVPCVVVLVERATDEVRAALPAELGGHPVDVRETGPLEALPD